MIQHFAKKKRRYEITTWHVLFFLFAIGPAFAQTTTVSSHFTIARLKYSGGGDWYNDPSMIPNMLDYLKKQTILKVATEEAQVGILDEKLFSYPFLFMTGHGRVSFNDKEVERLRAYLEQGGFLYVDDDYGLDQYFRPEIAKLFPEKNFLPVPFDHDIFHSHFNFANGLPKIHEHDGKPPESYAYFHEGRMVVFYTYETNISDGWADPDVHKDPPEVREKALQMGTNIIIYALTQ